MCQYSSLRYVSFPTQVTFKSGKIVPTMAVGRFVTGASYGWKDYGKALAITVCVIGFSLSMEHSDSKGENATKLIGVGLMCLFLLCDALTSNGEKRIFNSYEAMSHWQMMFMMAIFAVMYTGISIAFQNPLGLFAFLMRNPLAWAHIFFLSFFAVSGSLFTFYIIKRYGPVVFSIMMTIRQIFSMTFSAILFGHEMSGMSCFFACCIFLILLGDAVYKFWTPPAKKAKEDIAKEEHVKREKAVP
jgi:adenosine 3'-phospho 5'-phosphosulfate transporter B2